MVTVDMSKTRQQISKRKRRLRRIQRRRLQKVRRQQHAQLVAAGAARQARQKAVQNWLQEEKRREKRTSNRLESPNKPRVRFADNVYVTEIPNVPAHSLPKPVSSPTGVRLVREREEQQARDIAKLGLHDAMPFSLLCAPDDDYDEDDDPDFVPDVLAEHINIQLPVLTRPKRRLIPHSVPVSNSSDSEPSKRHKKAFPNASPASTPPKPSQRQNKSPKQSTEHSNNASSTKANAVGQSSERKRTLSQMLSTQDATSADTSQDAVDRPPSSVKASDSPRRRKKKRRKLSNVAQTDQGATHQPLSPKPAESNASPKKAQPAASPSQNGPNSPKVNSALVEDHVGKQNGTLSNDDNNDSDIDAMFGHMVRRKAQVKAEQRNRKKAENPNGEKPVSAGDKRKSQKRKGPTRYTEEGFRIMSYDDIKADQPAGLNGDCPFDCSCCF